MELVRDLSRYVGEMKRVMPLLMYVATWYTRDLCNCYTTRTHVLILRQYLVTKYLLLGSDNEGEKKTYHT